MGRMPGIAGSDPLHGSAGQDRPTGGWRGLERCGSKDLRLRRVHALPPSDRILPLATRRSRRLRKCRPKIPQLPDTGRLFWTTPEASRSGSGRIPETASLSRSVRRPDSLYHKFTRVTQQFLLT